MGILLGRYGSAERILILASSASHRSHNNGYGCGPLGGHRMTESGTSPSGERDTESSYPATIIVRVAIAGKLCLGISPVPSGIPSTVARGPVIAFLPTSCRAVFPIGGEANMRIRRRRPAELAKSAGEV